LSADAAASRQWQGFASQPDSKCTYCHATRHFRNQCPKLTNGNNKIPKRQPSLPVNQIGAVPQPDPQCRATRTGSQQEELMELFPAIQTGTELLLTIQIEGQEHHVIIDSEASLYVLKSGVSQSEIFLTSQAAKGVAGNFLEII